MDKEIRRPSFLLALVTFLSIISILVIGIFLLKVGLHILLILGLVVTAIAAWKIGYEWEEIQAAMSHGVSRALAGIFIIILIGMLIGSWIEAGTVPALIYYGLDLLSPRWFLPAGLIICSLVSLATGTSWGTAGTVGLALMGIGVKMGIPAPLVAGMVLSGASLGDKLSPISDTSNLAAISAEARLYDHIGAMMYSILPSYIITLILFIFLGFKYSGAMIDAEQIDAIQETIAGTFHISLWLLLPMILLLILSIMKIPSVPAMIAGVFTGSMVSMIFGGASLSEVLTAINYGFIANTGLPAVDSLLDRGGIQSMMWTFSLVFIALALGGVLAELHFMEVLIEKFVSKITRPASLVTLTILSATLTNAAMGEMYLSIILNGRLYSKAFEEKGLQRRMLSRCLVEGAAFTSVLIPWATTGAFMTGALGVSTLQYAPYAFLNWIVPLLSIVMVNLGYYILYIKDAQGGQL